MENNADQPAFTIATDHNVHAEGLTKREYFAGLAMQGLVSNSELLRNGATDQSDRDKLIEAYVEDAIKLSDELLNQLSH